MVRSLQMVATNSCSAFGSLYFAFSNCLKAFLTSAWSFFSSSTASGALAALRPRLAALRSRFVLAMPAPKQASYAPCPLGAEAAELERRPKRAEPARHAQQYVARRDAPLPALDQANGLHAEG